MRLRAQKWNVGPERRKGLGTSRAYVWGNARHFCEAEPDYTGYEGERSGLNHWTKPTQASLKTMCVWFGPVDVVSAFSNPTKQGVRQKDRSQE